MYCVFDYCGDGGFGCLFVGWYGGWLMFDSIGCFVVEFCLLCCCLGVSMWLFLRVCFGWWLLISWCCLWLLYSLVWLFVSYAGWVGYWNCWFCVEFVCLLVVALGWRCWIISYIAADLLWFAFNCLLIWCWSVCLGLFGLLLFELVWWLFIIVYLFG